MVTETAESLCKSVGRVIHSDDRSETECGDFMRIRVEVVRVCGMGVPNSISSQGQSMMERPAINTGIEVPNNVDMQRGKLRGFEANVDGECGTVTMFPIRGAVSNILWNEEAF
ncbi:hypothetical protein SO802_012697 [Lithocarpus litseifolius]|uniref:Uncharacterized protein n=1 Tax=Lithocarpus litseifolius TaxID=425828 RepID=A0AAW2D8X7_9ROSI